MNVALRNMEDASREKMLKLFNIAYFVAKEELPFTKFAKLCFLHERNNLELGRTYFNDHACRLFIEHIANVMRSELCTKLKASRFFSVMCDGSTDSAVLEQELIYVRFIDNGLPVSKFVSIQELKSGDAPGIIMAIDAAFEFIGFDSSEWKERLIGFGADGAAVMLGKSRGVAALLKHEVAHMIEIHCVAHRLELGILDAMKHERKLKDVKETLQGIYKHYRYSSKALRELREIAEALEISVLKPVNVMGTRWVSHLSRALKVLLRNMRHIVLHFQHTIEARSSSAEMIGRAKFVLRQLQSFKTIMFMHFILDILEECSIISQVFQKEACTITNVCTSLDRVELGL